MSRLLKGLMLCIFISVIGCNDKNHGNNAHHEGQISRYDESLPSITDEPANIDNYALFANGKIQIKGKLETDGPLADILSNERIILADNNTKLTGSLLANNVSSVAMNISDNYIVNLFNVMNITHVSSVISETSESYTGYIFHNDGTIEKKTNGVAELSNASVFNGAFAFINNKWHLVKNDANINENTIFETDLFIDGMYALISAPLFVTGNLETKNYFEIDINDPFGKCLIVDGNITIVDISIVGKIESLGDITINGNIDIIGTIKTEKSILIEGNARINYLDTIYKAAIGGAQSEFTETLLAHSQVFKDLYGRNAMAMFTFARGYVQTNESMIMQDLQNGSIIKSNYYSRFVGATLDYGTGIGGEEGLSIYYSNKLYIENYLKAKGHTSIRIAESLFIPAEAFYLTYSDQNNSKIATYQVYGSGLMYEQGTVPVELTDSQRVEMKLFIEKKSQEIASVAFNTSKSIQLPVRTANTISKAQLSTVGIADEDVSKTPEELRINEWTNAKNLVEHKVEVDVTVFDDSLTSANASIFSVPVGQPQKGRWKKIKRTIKKYVKEIIEFFYHIEWQSDCISDVSPDSTTDLWSNNVWLDNHSKDCGPISGAMIFIWNDIRRNVSENRDLSSDRSSAWARYDPGNRIDWIKPYHGMGKLAYQLDDCLNSMMSDLGISGSASWQWGEFSASPILVYEIVTNRLMYEDFCHAVRNNNPPIVGMFGLSSWSLDDTIDHYMPVIGYKTKQRKVLNIDTVIFDETYLYTDTTWGYKKYWRFDWYSSPFNFRSMLKVNVDGPIRVTVTYKDDYTSRPTDWNVDGGFPVANRYPIEQNIAIQYSDIVLTKLPTYEGPDPGAVYVVIGWMIQGDPTGTTYTSGQTITTGRSDIVLLPVLEQIVFP
jgi:hypothetical protein